MANRVLRRFGFRQVLIYNALIAGALMAMCGLFTQESTRLFMMVVIFLGGLFRSLQFTALNTVAFAEVEHADMSQATSFSQMIQRLSLSSGVAFSAFILFMVGGENPQMPVEAFATAFVIVGLISALSFLSFFQLAEDAGAEIAGRQPIRSRRFDRD